MRLIDLYNELYFDLKLKYPDKDRGILSIFYKGIPTNEEYIKDRIKAMKIDELIKEFGWGADVWMIWAATGKPDDLPKNIITKAFKDCYTGNEGYIAPQFRLFMQDEITSPPEA